MKQQGKVSTFERCPSRVGGASPFICCNVFPRDVCSPLPDNRMNHYLGKIVDFPLVPVTCSLSSVFRHESLKCRITPLIAEIIRIADASILSPGKRTWRGDVTKLQYRVGTFGRCLARVHGHHPLCVKVFVMGLYGRDHARRVCGGLTVFCFQNEEQQGVGDERSTANTVY